MMLSFGIPERYQTIVATGYQNIGVGVRSETHCQNLSISRLPAFCLHEMVIVPLSKGQLCHF